MATLLTPPAHFTARVVTGAGRGKDLGTPTLNLDLHDVSSALAHGIYACRVSIPELAMANVAAAAHFGPRPVFQDSVAFEVHLLDTTLAVTPVALVVDVIAFLREVLDFPDTDALKHQIADDIAQTKEILKTQA